MHMYMCKFVWYVCVYWQMSAVAVDISKDACELTLENAERLGMSERIKVLHGNICREKCLGFFA